MEAHRRSSREVRVRDIDDMKGAPLAVFLPYLLKVVSCIKLAYDEMNSDIPSNIL